MLPLQGWPSLNRTVLGPKDRKDEPQSSMAVLIRTEKVLVSLAGETATCFAKDAINRTVHALWSLNEQAASPLPWQESPNLAMPWVSSPEELFPSPMADLFRNRQILASQAVRSVPSMSSKDSLSRVFQAREGVPPP